MVTMLDGLIIGFLFLATAVGAAAGWYVRGRHDEGEM